MNQAGVQYEIHLHGSVPLRHDVTIEQIEKILEPLWKFTEGNTFEEGAKSYYSDEPGLMINKEEHTLFMCWTVQGDDTFDEVMQDLCKNLNEFARVGAPIEVSYIDLDDDDTADEYHLLFVGPNPQAIVNAQRDLLIREVMELMERHFDATQLNGVVNEVNRLFEERIQEASEHQKVLWTGIPFSGLCEPTKKRLH